MRNLSLLSESWTGLSLLEFRISLLLSRVRLTPASLSPSPTLRPTVSRPVYLGIRHSSEAYDQIFILVWQSLVCWFGAPSLTRGRVCRLQLLLAFASAVIFGSFYCLKFETSLFVASYDSQGHGGGIRPRLHTGHSCESITCPFMSRFGPQTEHTLERFLCCNLRICCHGNACLPIRCPATVYSALPGECAQRNIAQQMIIFRLSGVMSQYVTLFVPNLYVVQSYDLSIAIFCNYLCKRR
jgi:hypothetical protein